MLFTTFQPNALAVDLRGAPACPGPDCVDVFAALSAEGDAMTVRLVNAGNASRAIDLQVHGADVQADAELLSLSSPLTSNQTAYLAQQGGVNPVHDPTLISTKRTQVKFVAGKPWVLPAQTFQVLLLRLKTDDQSHVLGPCYHRKNVNLAKCTHTGANAAFTLYTERPGRRGSWVEHRATNCCCSSEEYGADNILPEPFSVALPLHGCQAACTADPACTAVVWKPGGTKPPPPPPAPPQPPVLPGAFDWIERIERSSGGRFFLNASTYLIDRQYQLPPNTEICTLPHTAPRLSFMCRVLRMGCCVLQTAQEPPHTVAIRRGTAQPLDLLAVARSYRRLASRLIRTVVRMLPIASASCWATTRISEDCTSSGLRMLDIIV